MSTAITTRVLDARCARKRTVLATAGAVAVLAAAASAEVLGDGTAQAARASAAPSEARVAKRLAKRLASRVVRARTPAARYKALLAVMRGLGVGVYTRRTKQIVDGSERGPRDFYLYDFELRILAGQLGESPIALDALAAEIGAHTRAAGGRGLEAGRLRRALVKGTRQAVRRPRVAQSLGPLLLRELGLRKRPRYDLARRAPAAAPFDALQRFLVMGEVFTPALKNQMKSRAGRARRTRAASVRARVAGPCSGDWGPVALVLKYGRWIAGHLPKSAVPEDLQIQIEGLHADLLAQIIRVRAREGESVTKGHYRPSGHDSLPGPAPGLRFVILAEADYGDSSIKGDFVRTAVECGRLAGLKLPEPGPVSGMDVGWIDPLRQGDRLRNKHSSAYHADAQTDANGRASLNVLLKEEIVPNFGRPDVDVGVLFPKVDLRGVFGRFIGFYVTEYLPWVNTGFASPRAVKFDWAVGFHKPPQTYRGRVIGSQKTSLSGVTATQSWTASEVVFELAPEQPSDDSIHYTLRDGTLEWQWAAAGLGCTWEATRTYSLKQGANGALLFRAKAGEPLGYEGTGYQARDTLWVRPSCPNGQGQPTPFEAFPRWWAMSPSATTSAPGPRGELSGHFQTTSIGYDTVTYDWSFVPEG